MSDSKMDTTVEITSHSVAVDRVNTEAGVRTRVLFAERQGADSRYVEVEIGSLRWSGQVPVRDLELLAQALAALGVGV